MDCTSYLLAFPILNFASKCVVYRCIKYSLQTQTLSSIISRVMMYAILNEKFKLLPNIMIEINFIRKNAKRAKQCSDRCIQTKNYLSYACFAYLYLVKFECIFPILRSQIKHTLKQSKLEPAYKVVLRTKP